MGTSFANLQIKTGNMDLVKDKLKSFMTNNNYMSKYLVGKFNEDIITVLGDSFSWDNISFEAQQLSLLIECPILSVGYYDDDILEISLFFKGKLMSSYASGNDEYEILPCILESEEFIEIFDLTEGIAKVQRIFENEDLEEVLSQLEEVLRTSLWIKYEWVEEDVELSSKFDHVVITGGNSQDLPT